MLTLNDGRNELWQWDTGRKLSVDADCSQVHFSNKVFGRSIDVDVIDGYAIIPDILLQTDKDLSVCAFVGTSENGYTKISKTFKVNRRNKPADYVFTPPDQTSLEEIKEKIKHLESIQDPDAIKNAVDDYLQNNPIQIDEKDPTVPEWAKQPEKPRYTADDVGAIPSTTKIPSKTSDLTNDSGFVNNAVTDLVNYYLKSETYSRDEVNQLISTIPKFSIKPVSQLPITGISETTIYLVPGGDGDDLYTEYIYVSGKWEILGSQKMDLTGYATETYVKDYAQPKGNYLTEVPEGYATEEFVKNKIAEAELGGTEIPSFPVQSVNGKTGDVLLTAEDVGALPDTYTPPNQTAEQVGADPKGTATTLVSQHNTADDSHNDIRLELKAINDRLTAFFDSDDQTLDELSEIVSYITNNKTLIESITTSKVSVADIVNNLTTNVSNKPLSAAQGVALKDLIDTVSNSLANYQPKGDYLESSELPTAVNNALAQAKASGEFDGADGKDGVDGKDGYTPVKGVDYFDGQDGADGQPGKDGISPVVAVSAITGGHRITITDANGTKTVDIMDGADGQDGQDGGVGAAGRGIKTIARTSGNGAAGTTDTYTITYTDTTTSTFSVYNGKDGATGGDGKDGITPHVGSNGNWFIGETDTGIPATGPAGANATINGVNTLTIAAGDGISASQSGNTLNLSVAGTFAGQVVANSSGQTPGTSLLRNSKLVSADTNPTVNGEINWTYK